MSPEEFDLHPMALWRSNAQGQRIQYNAAFAQLWNLQPQSETQDQVLFPLHIEADFKPKWELLHQFPQNFSLQYKIQPLNSQCIEIRELGQSLFDQNQNFCGYLGCSINLSTEIASLRSQDLEIQSLKQNISETLKYKNQSNQFTLRLLQQMQSEPQLGNCLQHCLKQHILNNSLVQSEQLCELARAIHLRPLLLQIMDEMAPVLQFANNRFADLLLDSPVLQLHLQQKHLHSILFECIWLLSQSVQNGILHFKNQLQGNQECIVLETWRNSEQNTFQLDHWMDLETRLPLLNELLGPHLMRLEISEFDPEHFSLSLLLPQKQFKSPALKVLALDDDEMNLALLQHMLQGQNMDLHVCNQAESALRYCHLHPDLQLILLDVMIPQTNGFEISKQMARICPNARILAITSLQLEDHFEAWMQSGIHDLINKPLHKQELLSKISLAHT